MRYKTVFIAFDMRDLNCVSLMSPDISNLHNFVGVETDYYLTLCGYSRFQLQEIYHSGHSQI